MIRETRGTGRGKKKEKKKKKKKEGGGGGELSIAHYCFDRYPFEHCYLSRDTKERKKEKQKEEEKLDPFFFQKRTIVFKRTSFFFYGYATPFQPLLECTQGNSEIREKKIRN
eukprot:TRINITY_DN1598_c0_g3_i2.p1 TRINITY_DN1598_c0_g3~~TRINITY_DN1598_c0_g3_i2.p1  ORF type:complete len:112 (+),score=20.26 TRINITY_DN1598_c0_g3_i2:242-577(+)